MKSSKTAKAGSTTPANKTRIGENEKIFLVLADDLCLVVGRIGFV